MHLRYFEAIAEARDQSGLFLALQDLAHELDFERFGLISHVPVDGGIRVGLVHNTPQAFVAEARDPAISQQDPVYMHSMRSNRPIVYNQDTYAKHGAMDLWDRQAPHGFETGISSAVSLGGSRVFFGLDRSAKLPRDEHRLTDLVAQVTTALVYAHDSLGLLSPADPRVAGVGLTVQQENILRMIAEGKSDTTIAQLTGLSKHGVNYHVRRIFKTLGISTRTQAIDLANKRRVI